MTWKRAIRALGRGKRVVWSDDIRPGSRCPLPSSHSLPATETEPRHKDLVPYPPIQPRRAMGPVIIHETVIKKNHWIRRLRRPTAAPALPPVVDFADWPHVKSMARMLSLGVQYKNIVLTSRFASAENRKLSWTSDSWQARRIVIIKKQIQCPLSSSRACRIRF